MSTINDDSNEFVYPELREGDDVIHFPDITDTRGTYGKVARVKHQSCDIWCVTAVGIVYYHDVWHRDDPRYAQNAQEMRLPDRGLFVLAPIEYERRALASVVRDLHADLRRLRAELSSQPRTPEMNVTRPRGRPRKDSLSSNEAEGSFNEPESAIS
jgi:hypothetical protein